MHSYIGTFIVLVNLASYITFCHADGHLQSCYDDPAMCLTELKADLTSTTEFWFGTSYAVNCPINPNPNPFAGQSTNCINPDTDSLSIVSRLLNLTDSSSSAEISAAVNDIKLAKVAYTAPSGSYFACGHNFSVPALNNYLLDPLTVSEAGLWSLNYMPEVTWEVDDPKAYYTVIVWDVGYYYIHGLYINAVRGSMSTGIPIDAYHGPRNIFLDRVVPYVFVVVKQTQFLEAGAVKGALNGVLFSNDFRFLYPQFKTFLSRSGQVFADKPTAMSLLRVRGDAYGIQFQKDNFIRNHCPFLVSQQPVLHNALTWANISAAWSYDVRDPMTSESQHGAPYLTALQVEIDVEYVTDDITFDSCCTRHTYIHSMIRADPLGSRSHRPVTLRTAPRLHITPIDIMSRPDFGGNRYTLLMVDFSRISTPPSDPAFYVHWIVTDIKGVDVTTGNTVKPYAVPNPFSDNGPRMYAFMMFEQKVPKLDTSGLINYALGYCQDPYNSMCRIQVFRLIEDWNLGDILGVTWVLAEQDAYARQRIYGTLMAQDRAQVCSGITGFSVPCPRQCTNTATKNLHVGTLMMLFFAINSLLVLIQ